jgi:vitamin B12 transporter
MLKRIFIALLNNPSLRCRAFRRDRSNPSNAGDCFRQLSTQGMAVVFAMTLNFHFAIAKNTPDDLPDTTINISAVIIASDRLQQFGIGNKTETLDSSQIIYQQSGSLTDVLQNESAVFIRSYGLGGLATVSIRGAASTQTAILWNGFNLQSPMNSLFDLSLLPAFFLDDTKVQHGSSGALFGSGAIGGSIHLNNVAHFDEGLHVRYAASYGSFNNWMQGGTIGWGNKKWYGYTRGFYHAAENNFKFQNLAEYGKPVQRLGNAALQQYGVLHEQGINFTKNREQKNLLSFRLWHQRNEREIPPAMTARESQQIQTDGIWRATATYEYSKARWETVFRNAYFNEKIFFNDPSISLDDDYNAHSVISEWENKIRFGRRHLLYVGTNYIFNRVTSKNYAGQNPVMHRGALFVSYRYVSLSQKIKAVASVREEMVNKQFTPVTPSVAGEYKPLKWLLLKANVSANFRVPNFNDWYWTLGGNPNLKPEKGWSQELGIVAEKKSEHFSFQTELTAFSSVINNRIVWLPNDINIWTPENVSKVWSRGLETTAKWNYRKKNFTVRFVANYQYIKATNAKNIANKNEAGRQLLYTPLHRALFQFTIGYKKTTLQYIHQLNGEMFYTADNTKSMPFYHIANLIISQSVSFGQYAFQFYAKANNLFNAAYQLIIWRPMPPVHFEAGLQFSFNHKSIKK